MIKSIGQRIFSFITKFKEEVYLKGSSGSTSTTVVVKEADGRLGTNGTFQSKGHHGYSGFIQILPSDFMVNEEDTDAGSFVVYDDSARGVTTLGDGNDLWAFVPIPAFSTATTVTIYGSDTSSVACYKTSFKKNTADSSLGTGNVGTAINISDTTASTSSELESDTDDAFCIGVKVTPANEETRVYGGLITITTE
tara:strand:- start:3174 stop:3758 length:585 start_codon:yes stop_codon:yes gene_type:complete